MSQHPLRGIISFVIAKEEDEEGEVDEKSAKEEEELTEEDKMGDEDEAGEESVKKLIQSTVEYLIELKGIDKRIKRNCWN